MDRIKNEIQQRTAQLKQFMVSLTVPTTAPQAAAKGSLLFLCSALALYTCGVFLFVALKWNSSYSQQSSQITIPSYWPPSMDQATVQRLLKNPDATMQHLEQQLQHIRDLVDQHSVTFSSAQSQLETAQQALKEATENSITIPNLMRRHTSKLHLTKRVPHLTAFLQSLPDKLQDAYPTPEELNEGVLMAIREIQDMLDDETMAWDTLTAWLLAPYWRNIRWHYFDGNNYCPDPSKQINTYANTTAQLSPNDQAFVDELVQTVRDTLAQRSNDPDENAWQAALDETREELEAFYQDKVAIASSQLKYLGSKYKRSLKKKSSIDQAAAALISVDDCPVTRDTIVSMVEAGLDAVYRKQDLRQAIAGVASSSTGGGAIILDAILDEPWKPPRSPYPETVNLRHMMDNQALKLLAKLIDDAFDRMGGYSDYIDSKIDALTANGRDPGTVATDFLLQQAAKVSIPVPLSVQKRKMAEQKP